MDKMNLTAGNAESNSILFDDGFYKGKSRNHVGKRITNSDKDSGLINMNTAK